MSVTKRIAAAVTPADDLSIEDILIASRLGGLHQPDGQGRRVRKQQERAKVARMGLLAPLLAAEGCLSLGQGSEDLPLDSGLGDNGATNGGTNGGTSGGTNGGNSTPDAQLAAHDDSFAMAPDESIEITPEELQANDTHDNQGTIELVRVFGAVNGTAVFDGNLVIFTPDEGYEGAASFKYEIRDANGNISEAVVEVNVASSAPSVSVTPADEHEALMMLVPTDEATHVAVNNGSWFDPNTWANGEVPGEGAKVYIPEGVTVNYDGESDASLYTVRVDGTLDFATDVDTFMEVDTMVVMKTGHLIIGTVDNPVEDGVSAVIQIADNGPIDTAWDPMLLSRGVVSMGEVDISGAEKENYIATATATDPMAGDTSLTLAEAPNGWEVGDRLVLTGTHLQDLSTIPHTSTGETQPDVYTEDEELVITAINGNTIHFDRALQYDHDAPRADLHAYVADYTRNVRIVTENADDLPVYQRGHVMLMGSEGIDVRYAEFSDLGRTDKSVRAHDVSDLDTVSYDSNVKGRYALHIHHAGVEDVENPVMLVGNAVWGSPGWGVVQHDSYAMLYDNATYDVFGASYAAETGNESGRWVHNIAIKSIGVGGWGSDNNPKVADDVVNFDLGRTGAGYWFQGRLIEVVDNVAAGVPSGQGFVYMTRAPEKDIIEVLPQQAAQPEALHYKDTAKIHLPAIAQFSDNEVIASNVGFMVVKASFHQFDDTRSLIDNFTAWEVNSGVNLEYTAHYTYTNLDLIAAPTYYAEHGMIIGKNSFDQVVNGANIVGFDVGIYTTKEVTFDYDGGFHYFFIDVNTENVGADFKNTDSGDTILTSADLIDQPLSFVSGVQEYPVVEELGNLWGVKSDSLGDVTLDDEYDRLRYEGETALTGAVREEGYWTLEDDTVITAFERYFTDRTTGELLKTVTFAQLPSLWWVENRLPADIDPVYHGVLDTASLAPIGGDDALTVASGDKAVIDVLANDSDPEDDPIAVDGLDHPDHGEVYMNDDGTVTYVADVNYTGDDEFWYWVEDFNGNYTKTHVQVTVVDA